MEENKTYIRTYHIKHKEDFKDLLIKARKVAEYAVKNKNKKMSSKNVKEHNLPAAISSQILRKYGKGTIKKVSNVNLIVPNQIIKNLKKEWRSIKYDKEIVTMTVLKKSFRWNPGMTFLRIVQIEISDSNYMISVSFEKPPLLEFEDKKLLGVDLNCGIGRHIANCGNLLNGHVMDFGRKGPFIRKQYTAKRRKQQIKNNREQRRMRDLDHQVSRKIVNYAFKHQLKIVLEDLSKIRNTAKKGEGSEFFKNRNKNRVVNSWSFYRLQKFIEYKSEELGIPIIYIHPHYTSQLCSYCDIKGTRDEESFECKNKKCRSFGVSRNSDRNAAFNIAKRALIKGGISTRYPAKLGEPNAVR